MQPESPALIADDLAPGDAAARLFDWSGLHIVSIRTPDHPLFQPVYRRLWDEFGGRGEMENETVIAARLGWDPARAINHHALRYEMLAVLRGAEIVALRDHTAIVPDPLQPGDRPGEVIVHLSHVIIEPPLRGSGLAGWLRALPIATARECAAISGASERARITLVAEMEHRDGMKPMGMARLRSYARAGFLQIDPDAVRYCQPDFRSPAEIDMTAVQPIPLALLIRRVGREAEPCIAGAAARTIVAALYSMFGVHVRADHMAPLWALLDHFPGPGDDVALRSPLP